MDRAGRDETYMNMAKIIAERSPCLSRNVGAVITDGKHIISVGYNGPPPGYPHCKVCLRERSGEELIQCPAIHAEANAIFLAGNSRLKGTTIYCTTEPCGHCTKLLICYGIETIIYLEGYKVSSLYEDMAKCMGIKKVKYEG